MSEPKEPRREGTYRYPTRRESFPVKIVAVSSEKRFEEEGLATLFHAPRMCLRCFPAGWGDLQNSLKGKRMAGTESKRATVYNKPGVGVRKMEHSRWLIALFILIIMYAGIYYYTKSVKAIATLGLPVALVVFVGIIHWIKAMGGKAEAVANRALDARRGAVAEEAAGNLPGELPAGYFVVNDFVSKRGNIDHIVISTKGILTVETKSHRGVVTCEGEMLKRDGKPFEKDLIKQAWAEAYSIRDLLTEKGVCNLRPQPVIVFTEADVQVRGKVRGVHIIGIKDLHAFLKGLPAWMSERLSKAMIDCLSSTQNYYMERVPKPKVVPHNIASDSTEEVVV